MTLLATGTRTAIAAAFGATTDGETTYAAQLTAAMGPDQIVLGDRNFDAEPLLARIAASGAHFLVRAKSVRTLAPTGPAHRDGSYPSRIGNLHVRVITADGAEVTTTTYRMITTMTDPAVGAADLVALYHQRWDVEEDECRW